MAGSLFVAYLNRGRIELGLTVIGGLIMPVSLIVLYFCNPLTLVFEIGCLTLGFSGALFFVPLNGYLQDQAEEDRRGRVLAAANLFTQLSGIAFIVFHAYLSGHLGLSAKEELLVMLVPSVLIGFVTFRAVRSIKEHMKELEEEKLRYNQWLQETRTKLSQGEFSSLGDKDRDELFLIYQLLVNGGSLKHSQEIIMDLALTDPATAKFLKLRGSQENVPKPENSLSPQMTDAFGTLKIATGAGIIQRGQIRQQLNEINENLEDGSKGEIDSDGFDF